MSDNDEIVSINPNVQVVKKKKLKRKTGWSIVNDTVNHQVNQHGNNADVYELPDSNNEENRLLETEETYFHCADLFLAKLKLDDREWARSVLITHSDPKCDYISLCNFINNCLVVISGTTGPGSCIEGFREVQDYSGVLLFFRNAQEKANALLLDGVKYKGSVLHVQNHPKFPSFLRNYDILTSVSVPCVSRVRRGMLLGVSSNTHVGLDSLGPAYHPSISRIQSGDGIFCSTVSGVLEAFCPAAILNGLPDASLMSYDSICEFLTTFGELDYCIVIPYNDKASSNTMLSAQMLNHVNDMNVHDYYSQTNNMSADKRENILARIIKLLAENNQYNAPSVVSQLAVFQYKNFYSLQYLNTVIPSVKFSDYRPHLIFEPETFLANEPAIMLSLVTQLRSVINDYSEFLNLDNDDASTKVPTRILCFRSILSFEECSNSQLYDVLKDDILSVCRRAGEVIDYTVISPTKPVRPLTNELTEIVKAASLCSNYDSIRTKTYDDFNTGVGSFIVEYNTVQSAVKMFQAFNKRLFNNKSVTIIFVDERFFDKDNITQDIIKPCNTKAGSSLYNELLAKNAEVKYQEYCKIKEKSLQMARIAATAAANQAMFTSDQQQSLSIDIKALAEVPNLELDVDTSECDMEE